MKITIERIVTSAQGSWKWTPKEGCFRVATYALKLTKKGKIVWKSVHNTCRYSAPQLRRLGLWDKLTHGSAHNREFQPADLIEAGAI